MSQEFGQIMKADIRDVGAPGPRRSVTFWSGVGIGWFVGFILVYLALAIDSRNLLLPLLLAPYTVFFLTLFMLPGVLIFGIWHWWVPLRRTGTLERTLTGAGVGAALLISFFMSDGSLPPTPSDASECVFAAAPLIVGAVTFLFGNPFPTVDA